MKRLKKVSESGTKYWGIVLVFFAALTGIAVVVAA